MLAAVITAVTATPKALKRIEETKEETGQEELTKLEIFRVTWPCYIPTAVATGLSITSFIGANTVNGRRNAALAAAYTVSESALRGYQRKVQEVLGDEKEKEVRNAVAKQKLEAVPSSGKEIVITGRGEHLCFDSQSGRYFKSDIEEIRRVQNEINKRLFNENTVTLNEFYYEIGLKSTKSGRDLGFDVSKGLLDIDFSSNLTDKGIPCLVLDYNVVPIGNFY